MTLSVQLYYSFRSPYSYLAVEQVAPWVRGLGLEVLSAQGTTFFTVDFDQPLNGLGFFVSDLSDWFDDKNAVGHLFAVLKLADNSTKEFDLTQGLAPDTLVTGNMAFFGVLDSGPSITSFAIRSDANIPGGDALVSGGVRSGQPSCLGTLACPSPQSARVSAGGVAASGVPGLARYGHRLTRLADGTILVSGGFTADAEGKIHALATLERFEPARAADDPLADLAIVRAPGEVAMENGAPLAPCTLVSGSPADAAPVDAAAPIDAEPDALEVDAMVR